MLIHGTSISYRIPHLGLHCGHHCPPCLSADCRKRQRMQLWFLSASWQGMPLSRYSQIGRRFSVLSQHYPLLCTHPAHRITDTLHEITFAGCACYFVQGVCKLACKVSANHRAEYSVIAIQEAGEKMMKEAVRCASL